MAEDCEKKAAELGFDLTKQFLTLSLAGIAFIVGLSFNSPGAISSLMLWCVVGVFGLSTALGLLFLMRGVSLLSVDKSFDIYTGSLRVLAVLQISLVVGGVIMLAPVLNRHPRNKAATNLEIKVGTGHSIIYPLDPTTNVIIEFEGDKAKVTTTPVGLSSSRRGP
jgi:hypothetical protein